MYVNVFIKILEFDFSRLEFQDSTFKFGLVKGFKGIALNIGHKLFEKCLQKFQKRSRMIPNCPSSLSWKMKV